MTTNRRPRKSSIAKSRAPKSKRRAMGPPEEIGGGKTRGNWLTVVGFAILLGGFTFAVIFLQGPTKVAGIAPPVVQTAIPFPVSSRAPAGTPNLSLPLIGLLAGHSGGDDPGATCPDGLREVDVTTDVAQRAKAMLEARGYRVDILAEFDVRLSATRRDYSPKVFLSIHADSCVSLSGYKIARAEYSATPLAEDRLVRCVSNAYAFATKLSFDENTITPSMRQYHALNKIDPQTPGAIIELGFLGGDKDLLKNRRDVLASGIAEGIDSFMKGNACQ